MLARECEVREPVCQGRWRDRVCVASVSRATAEYERKEIASSKINMRKGLEKRER